MGNLEGILLGILQGITEFLPVSSSAHLVIAQDLLNVKQFGILFEVMVHFGTLLSVLWIFGSDIVRIATRFTREKQERHFAFMLLLGIIPTGLIGFLFRDLFISFYESTLKTGFMLLITGCILYFIPYLKPGVKNEQTISATDALIVSVAQGLAIIPGLSRSGFTITAALWCGMDRETAVRFSFLVTIPVILGATLLELSELRAVGFSGISSGIIYGTIAAFITGIFAIKLFVKLLRAGRFNFFAYYCWFVGTATIIFKLTGFWE
ncbi:MAG: Undecaprenyl-diphosphatase [Dehalococcoidia bacterium]|nr:Undecaprenyl-diphosphatase [Bacillota bacterium]MBT9143206.1 Undecaprenyl-diphosphatase [Bacillota bacterium]